MYVDNFRHGNGGSGFIPVVGKIILQSAASFSVFMSIGGLVRCDDADDRKVK